MSLETIISTLSRDEKLAALDLIWRDLTMDESSFVSPHWHDTVIADRLANPATGDAKWRVTWPPLSHRLAVSFTHTYSGHTDKSKVC